MLGLGVSSQVVKEHGSTPSLTIQFPFSTCFEVLFENGFRLLPAARPATRLQLGLEKNRKRKLNREERCRSVFLFSTF